MNTSLKYRIAYSKKFKQDIKRLERSGYDLEMLWEIVRTIARGEPLPARCRNHRLKGRKKDMEECHVAPDWLLIYERQNDILILLLTETGTHSQLFGH